MLAGLVERALPHLELLAQRARTLGEPFQVLSARLERRDHGVHIGRAALRPLDGGNRGGHELLDSRGLVGVSRQRLEPLVGAVHPGEQPAAPLLQLSAQGRELGEPLVQFLDELAARFDLRQRLGQPVGFGPH